MRSLALALLSLLVPAGAAAIDEPDYDVAETRGDFELRRYRPYLVAQTRVEGVFDDVGGDGFRVLFDYIRGANRAQQPIEMTAPVTQTPDEAGRPIEMTAPVTQTPIEGQPGRYVIGFVMPTGYTLETLPVPTDARVEIRAVPARLVAARRYSGFWSERRYREQEAALLDALEVAGLEPVGPPVYARYDSPFSLWFWRRNEVWVEVAPRDG